MKNFVSGTYAIPAESSDLTLAGLAFGFTPVSVSVSVRLPAGTDDIVSAYLVGTPTDDGFSVAFSAPIPASGYLLDYTAFSDDGGVVPVDGESMSVSYGDLVREVAVFLGYDPESLTEYQRAQVDGFVQSGVRNFYYPPKMDGVDEHFEWSFIRQTGSVSVVAGVADYNLPDGFGRIAGQIAVLSDPGPTLPVIPYGDIVRMRQRGQTARPRFASVTSSQAFGSRGQMKQIHLFPTPDKDYTLTFVCDSDTGKIDATNRPYPLGGAMYSELIIESCLAVAEQRANDEEGLHTKKFNELLVSTIARDRKSSAQSFGDIGDPEARGCSPFIPLATRGYLY